MRYSIFFLLLFLSLASYSQTRLTFHDEKGVKVDQVEKAVFMRNKTLNPAGNVEVIEVYSNNNKTKLKAIQKSFDEEYYIGLKLEAYKDGTIKSKETYSFDGLLIDTAYYYHANGKLKYAFEYPYKLEEKKTTVTDTLILMYKDSTGAILLTNGNGYAEITTGSTIEKGKYENHKKTGEWIGSFEDERYKFKENYENGQLTTGVTVDSTGNTYSYTKANFFVEPEYPGGVNILRNFIASNYVYSPSALDVGVSGTMKASFVVNKDGKIGDITIIEDLGHGTGDEFKRVLKKLRQWTPGTIRGVIVRVKYNLPLRLNLAKN